MLAKEYTFCKAKPIWQTGCTKQINKTLIFKTTVDNIKNATLSLACSTSYILYINGKFVATGPARTAHGYHRVDQFELDSYFTENNNIISIHVTGNYAPAYSIARNEAFFCGEVIANGNVLAATDPDGAAWRCVDDPGRVQKVHKYSEQRLSSEVYRLSPATQLIDTDYSAGNDVSLQLVESGTFIQREVYYADYEPLQPKKLLSQGTFTLQDPDGLKMPIYYDQSSYETDIGKYKVPIIGYPLEDQEFDYAMHAKRILCQPSPVTADITSSIKLNENCYTDLDLGCNYTGLIRLNVHADTKTTLYVMFDELLDDQNQINITRLSCINLVVWELEPGDYCLTTAEPYTLKYMRIACVEGSCTITDPMLLRVSFPKINKKLISQDSKLQMVYDAAVETFRQNVYDVYMDCPSRERAGWLCDSYFIARAEYALTGNALVERAFLANFLLPESIPNVPTGMLPMCYPAEIPRVRFIPNWAMFFILELEEYLERTGDTEFIQSAKPKMIALLSYFRQFENEYGLLENLDGWVFVEWSMANKLTAGVNFPSNMLFARVKRALAKLYNMPELYAEADEMDRNILKLSQDGLFFCDNALRQDGKLVLSGEHTEVCQYYAFFCGTITPESHPDLWKTMVEEFGPQRSDAYPEIHSANTFIGHYLRLEIFHRYCLKENVLENIVGYFHYMAEKVGTLWENKTPHASCCHGFTSCVTYWLDKFGMLS